MLTKKKPMPPWLWNITPYIHAALLWWFVQASK